MFDQSRRRILAILDDALLLTQMEIEGDKFKSVTAALNTVLNKAFENVGDFARSREVTLKPPPKNSGFLLGEEDLLVRAMQALIETAVKFSVAGETIGLDCEASKDSIRLHIESRGRTVPTAAIAKFFDLFSISEASTPAGDLGLGPPVAYRILSLFGGAMGVENLNPDGLRLTVSLRTAQP